MGWFFFFQAEDGIRDLVRSRGLGDVYKRQGINAEYGRPNETAMATHQVAVSETLPINATALSLEEAVVLKEKGEKAMKQAMFGFGCSLCLVFLSWIPFCTSGVMDEVKPLKARYEAKGIFIPPCFSAVCNGEVNNVSKERCEAPDGPMPKLIAFMETEQYHKMMAKLQRAADKKKAAAGGTTTAHGTM
eukprot:TRINITY_DN17320_c0_g1_i1.p1 TRINITY_DN17320_c0_g1~~TRINITY_DN17320_c0_g1_i1.p1  ORF type:complete len:189 (-),score=53.25 TRINITY_DN17320_c0_g1_i1:137-703(-)